jgi:hypothetical protein
LIAAAGLDDSGRDAPQSLAGPKRTPGRDSTENLSREHFDGGQRFWHFSTDADLIVCSVIKYRGAPLFEHNHAIIKGRMGAIVRQALVM